jgi:hypothetical protein
VVAVEVFIQQAVVLVVCAVLSMERVAAEALNLNFH